ncbi:unnamed protein product [Dovyalis caffra]|uniref:Uncharacterized protein n=1 Tax=Dovyalis caffra TaxID=77055 RepID=A0AAV1SBZ5_9ROSI|nr:unnamed protein product [Dovyalis caffra]
MMNPIRPSGNEIDNSVVLERLLISFDDTVQGNLIACIKGSYFVLALLRTRMSNPRVASSQIIDGKFQSGSNRIMYSCILAFICPKSNKDPLPFVLNNGSEIHLESMSAKLTRIGNKRRRQDLIFVSLALSKWVQFKGASSSSSTDTM